VEGFIKSEHTEARKFFVEVDHPAAGKFACPGPPYKWSETSCKLRFPAPLLGEHNERFYGQELGYSKEELAALRRAEVI